MPQNLSLALYPWIDRAVSSYLSGTPTLLSSTRLERYIEPALNATMTTTCSANESIRNRLEADAGSKFGFTIYRCTYKSDARWHDFMTYHNAVVRASLAKADLSDCFDRLDWDVQENADYEEMWNYEARVYRLPHGSARRPADSLCSMFKKWVASGEEHDDALARYMGFICVGEQTFIHLLEMRLRIPDGGSSIETMATSLPQNE
jgi:hypothetical protein